MSISRHRALERIEELLCEAVERTHGSWLEKMPMPPNYVQLLKEAHKALLDGMRVTGAGESEASTPEQLLIELEEARQRVLRQIAMKDSLPAPGAPKH